VAEPLFASIRACRGCGGGDLRLVLDLGKIPLVDQMPNADALAYPDPRYPLRVAVCADCSLVQLLEAPPPERLFPADYPYYSSYSQAYLAHAARFAEESCARFGLGQDSLVVEVGSNDGYLLHYFKELGVPVLGIDPAPGPALAARGKGVPTRVQFFDAATAQDLVASGRRADLLVANNLLAHVPEPNPVLQAMKTLLAPGGALSIEVPYLRDLIEGCAFDTIYHEHHCYFSVTALEGLFRRNGFTLVDAMPIPVHGGSLRLTIRHAPATPCARVAQLLEEEASSGLHTQGLTAFSESVSATLAELSALLARIHRQGEVIAAYGAAAKGVVLLNLLGVSRDQCAFVVDRNPHKHGRWLAGVRIPIRPLAALLDEMPHYTLLLAWNWQKEILEQQAEYLKRGGRFIVPLPRPTILPSGA
jgi:SAM-dependent methyltransferase